MNLTEHIEEHIALGLDFRIPMDGPTYIKFVLSNNTIEFYCNNILAMRLP